MRSSSDGPQTARDRRAAGDDLRARRDSSDGLRRGRRRATATRRDDSGAEPAPGDGAAHGEPGDAPRGQAAPRGRGSCGDRSQSRSGRRPPGGCATRSASRRAARTSAPGTPSTSAARTAGRAATARDELVRMLLRVARESARTAADRRPQPPARGRLRETLRADRPRLAPERPRRGRLLPAQGRETACATRRIAQVDREAGPGTRRPLRATPGAKKIFVGAGLRLRGPAGIVQPWPNHDDHLHVQARRARRAPCRRPRGRARPGRA